MNNPLGDKRTEKQKRRNQQPPPVAGEIYTTLTIGGRIRFLREKLKMKQVELSRKCGLTQAAISNLETDASRKPSAPTLLRIAQALEANPGWILTGIGDPHVMPAITDHSHAELLTLFMIMTDEQRKGILAAARAMVTPR